MLKLAGCILTVGGCVGLGYWYRRQFVDRIRHIKILISLVDMMMSEVRYSKAPLPECCRRLSGRLEEPYRESLVKIWEEARENTGISCNEIFTARMRECLNKVPLGQQEIQIFLELTARFGYEETQMQLNSMEGCREQLKSIALELEREVSQKGRLAMGLGTLGGLLLTVILV